MLIPADVARRELVLLKQVHYSSVERGCIVRFYRFLL